MSLWLASALACLVGSRRIATGRATTAQMRSFSSTSEYEQALAAEATLPSGFQVGTAGFRFSPAEAAEGTCRERVESGTPSRQFLTALGTRVGPTG